LAQDQKTRDYRWKQQGSGFIGYCLAVMAARSSSTSWRLFHTLWGCGRSASSGGSEQGSSRQKLVATEQKPCDCDGNSLVDFDAEGGPSDAKFSADEVNTLSTEADNTTSIDGESSTASCSQESTQDHSDTKSILSCDSFCSSCSTDDSSSSSSVDSHTFLWLQRAATVQLILRAAESDKRAAKATRTAAYWASKRSGSVVPVTGHRPLVSINEYSWQQFAADREDSCVSVEEGWDGLVVWPRRIPSEVMHRETWSPIAHHGERSRTLLYL